MEDQEVAKKIAGLSEEEARLFRIRHSLAHVMAQAVLEFYPDAKLGFGPPIDTGFYYDFDLPEPLTAEDLPKIEQKMKEIIKAKQEFTRVDCPAGDAITRIESMNQPYKLQQARELAEKGVETISIYQNGPFADMCEGPHVQNTGELPRQAFKLDSIAGAYWKGSEKNKMLTRLYGLGFATKEELKSYLARRELARERDHKKLGRELDLFHIDDEVGKGLILWMPKGTVLRDEVETLAREFEFRYEYERVATPHVAKAQLYYKSGHLPYYTEGMFPPMELDETIEPGAPGGAAPGGASPGDIDASADATGGSQHGNGADAAVSGNGGAHVVKETFYLKPMNCPHHHIIYASRPRSYRDLPMRLAEYGTVYRFEKSGELSGLLRVRMLSMNDAHIYLRQDQLKDEIKSLLRMYQEIYAVFDLKNYYLRLSLHDPDRGEKYHDDEHLWNLSETALKEALDEAGVTYVIGEDEAAFYGPKIDIQFTTLMGREESVSTIQVDYLSGKRFELRYVDEHGEEQTPVIVHRAPLSTHERMMAYLIEHYGGAFPTWMAPVQVRLITISDDQLPYAEELRAALRADMVRAEIDRSTHSFNKKIRSGTVEKIPILLVLGKKESQEGAVTVRRYRIPEQRTIDFETFRTELLEEIAARIHVQPES